MLYEFVKKEELDDARKEEEEFDALYKEAFELISNDFAMEAHQKFLQLNKDYPNRLYDDPNKLFEFARCKTRITHHNKSNVRLCQSLFTEVNSLIESIQAFQLDNVLTEKMSIFNRDVKRWSKRYISSGRRSPNPR